MNLLTIKKIMSSTDSFGVYGPIKYFFMSKSKVKFPSAIQTVTCDIKSCMASHSHNKCTIDSSSVSQKVQKGSG